MDAVKYLKAREAFCEQGRSKCCTMCQFNFVDFGNVAHCMKNDMEKDAPEKTIETIKHWIVMQQAEEAALKERRRKLYIPYKLKLQRKIQLLESY